MTGIRDAGASIDVIGAEPLAGNRAARSLRAGTLVTLEEAAKTIADGARTLSLGKHNWEILRTGLSGIVEVDEDNIKEAVRLVFHFANLKAEPAGALSVAALLTSPNDSTYAEILCD